MKDLEKCGSDVSWVLLMASSCKRQAMLQVLQVRIFHLSGEIFAQSTRGIGNRQSAWMMESEFESAHCTGSVRLTQVVRSSMRKDNCELQREIGVLYRMRDCTSGQLCVAVVAQKVRYVLSLLLLLLLFSCHYRGKGDQITYSLMASIYDRQPGRWHALGLTTPMHVRFEASRWGLPMERS